jgi:hypothetical protein
MGKTCKACGAFKPLSEFYTHRYNADGYLNRCKDCVKARVKTHRQANLERIREYDRKRGQQEDRKAAARGRAARYKDRQQAYLDRYYQRRPEAKVAHDAVKVALKSGQLTRLPCERCGTKALVQAHHDDYTKPLEVQWLCPAHHGERHRELNEARRRAS